MFAGALKFNQNLNSWKLKEYAGKRFGMFYNCLALDQQINLWDFQLNSDEEYYKYFAGSENMLQRLMSENNYEEDDSNRINENNSNEASDDLVNSENEDEDMSEEEIFEDEVDNVDKDDDEISDSSDHEYLPSDCDSGEYMHQSDDENEQSMDLSL